MNEARFRSLMHDAVGEEPMRPWLNEAVRSRIGQPQTGTRPVRWLGLVAACLAIAIVAATAGTRLLNRTTSVVPAATPSPVATPKLVSASNCTLPVLVGAGVPGYVNTASGLFTRDDAGTNGLPGGAAAKSYDTVVRRWVPVPASWTSPDGSEYAYTAQNSAAHTDLHIYRFDTGTDRVVFTASGGVFIRAWMADGIHYDTESEVAGTEHVFDPSNGKQSVVQATAPHFTPLPGDPQGGIGGAGFHSIGYTTDGHPIFWFFNLDVPTQVDWVFYETSPGVRVYVYRGTMDDATGFEPGVAAGDPLGLWFSDYHAGSRIWHWDAANGLKAIALTNVPGGIDTVPAGACF